MAKSDWYYPLQQIAYRFEFYTVFRDFLEILGCCYSMKTREDQYFAVIKKYDKDQLLLFSEAMAKMTIEMTNKPYTDILGDLYMEHVGPSDRQTRGLFFTPVELCEAIATLVGIDTNDLPLKLSEPACGSGRMIGASVKRFVELGHIPFDVRVDAWDNNLMCVHMAMVNFSLWSIPAQITYGNTLTLEVHDRYYTPAWHQHYRIVHYSRMLDYTKRVEKLGKGHEQGGLFEGL